MPEYTAPRGTNDLLPSESPKWQYLERKFREICELYGYREIRTPTFEHTELFTRNLGEATDVVSKEMYTFDSRSGKSLTLRPEGTAPAIRAYAEHNLGATLPLVKMYYIARIFRYERPQAGRYREHTQLGIEAVGVQSPAFDAEVISFATKFFESVGIDEYKVKLNSIGCPECRPDYRKALVDYIETKVDAVCGSCRQRYAQNPMRMLDCKEPGCKQIMADAPKITQYLCGDCSAHFAQVQESLAALGIGFTLDPHLVRGFDYYTKTAFEFSTGKLGSQDAIGGGGRYDNMVGEIGKTPAPAIGFGLGLDRLMLMLEAMGVELPVKNGVDAYIATLGGVAQKAALKIGSELRGAGVSCEVDYTGRSLKAQMKTASKLSAGKVIIIGEDEVNAGRVALRDMESSEQIDVDIDKILDAIKG